jgi:hypothetical protein
VSTSATRLFTVFLERGGGLGALLR